MRRLLICSTFLFFLIFLNIATISHAQEYQKQEVIDVNLHYKDDLISLNSIEKQLGYLPDYRNQPQEGYTLSIYDKNLDELFEVKFTFPLQRMTEDISQEGKFTGSTELLTEVTKIVTVPVFENADSLKVFDPEGKLLITHDLSLLINLKVENQAPAKAFWLPVLVLILLIVALLLFFKYLRRNKFEATGKEESLLAGSLTFLKSNVSFLVIIILISVVLMAAWFLKETGNIQFPPKSVPDSSPVSRFEPKTMRKEGYEIKRRITKTDKKSGDLIVHDNSDFTITYLISNEEFIVEVKNPPYEDTKQKAEAWFKEQGFTADELCLLRITFTASKEIRPDNLSLRDTRPTGCEAP